MTIDTLIHINAKSPYTTFVWHMTIPITDFFHGYKAGRRGEDGKPQMLKLKDWPPNSTFKEAMPHHWKSFLSILPLHPYVHREKGILNLASYQRQTSLPPDLGPKAYIAYGQKKETESSNSVTNLHCDVADAVSTLQHYKYYVLRDSTTKPSENHHKQWVYAKLTMFILPCVQI